MDVTSISAERAQAIEDASIVDGYVNDQGNLVLVNGAGAEINAGAIQLSAAWPVGSVYIGVTNTNPAALLGGGTWSRFANGRVLVGVDETDTDFDTVLEERGAKTHTLTSNEMPVHSHQTNTQSAGGHTHTATATGGGHEHYYDQNQVQTNMAGGGSLSVADVQYVDTATEGGGGHTHNFTTDSGGAHTHVIPNDGGGAAHNNLQPLITVYMWQRTA